MTPRPLKVLAASSWCVVLLCVVALLFLGVAGPNVISGQTIQDCTKDVEEIRTSTDFRWVQQTAKSRTQLLAYTMAGSRGLLIVSASVILICGFSAGISLWQLRRLKRDADDHDAS